MNDFRHSEISDIKNRSLSGYIYKELEEKIISGSMKPGSRINESKLARELNVSRAPIREAIGRLEKMGFVKFQPNQGSYIARMGISEVSELCDIRAVLDSLAAEKAAENFKPEHLKEFEPIIAEMETMVQQGDSRGFFDVNLRFHLLIITISGNRSLYNLYEGTYKKTALFRSSFVTAAASMSKSLKEHKKIVKALSKNDPGRASSFMREHILSAKAEIIHEFVSRSKRSSSVL
jgi:DNA-binding GntR family transcriptional regulator